jgi:hypothetical protein
LTIKGYEITPFRAVVPAIPEVATGSLVPERIKAEQEISIAGLRTEPTTLHSAGEQATEMLAECRRRVSQREYHALIELLDANPAFIADRWVRETLLDLIRRKLLARRRGRIEGKRRFHPLVVVGLVEHLIACGQAATPEKAFVELDNLGVLKYETAKDLYYRGRQQDRFRPILLEFPDLTQRISLEEGNALLHSARVLRPGEKTTYRGHHPVLGETELVIGP